jgi:hypothetical protein
MKEEIKCQVCKKIIKENEFRVNFRELQLKPITLDCDLSFHRDCWIKHYNESIDKKVQYMAKSIMKNSAPMIKEFADKYGGMLA